MVLAVLLFFRVAGNPTARSSAKSREWAGGTTSRGTRRREELPGSSSTAGRPAILRVSAFRTQVRHVAAERHATWVVVQCEAITDIDVSAAKMLEQLDRELNATGIHMAFAEMRSRLQDLVRRYGLSRRSTVTASTRASRPRSRPWMRREAVVELRFIATGIATGRG